MPKLHQYNCELHYAVHVFQGVTSHHQHKNLRPRSVIETNELEDRISLKILKKYSLTNTSKGEAKSSAKYIYIVPCSIYKK